MPLLEFCVTLPVNFLYLLNRLKLSSLQYRFQLDEERDVCWCKVWQERRLGDECSLMFCEKIMNRKGGMHWSVVTMQQPFSPSTNQFFLSSLPVLAFSSPSDNIPRSLSGHKADTHDELSPHNHKTQSASLLHWTKLAVLFWVWLMFLRIIVKTRAFVSTPKL